MKKQVLFFVFTMLICSNSFSQINFEKGYFINETNQKIEAFIKNVDWRNTPEQFDYTLTPGGTVHIGSLNTVKEFAFNGRSKFIRSTIQIDRSSDAFINIDSKKNPNFQEEQLFLEVLIEGEASLYQYKDNNLTRFFYTLNESEPKQLVYKRYLINKNVATNNHFRQQLNNELKCEAIETRGIENLMYNQDDLQKIFIKYNTCIDSDYVDYVPEQKRDNFNLYLRPGFNHSTLKLQPPFPNIPVMNLDDQTNIRLGIEAEFILPFHKNKWAVIIEPSYGSYKAETLVEAEDVQGGTLHFDINYQYIQIPLGLRHYFFLNDNSKIFVDVSYTHDLQELDGDSSIKAIRKDGTIYHDLPIKSNGNVGLGLGFNYGSKYSLGMKFHPTNNILAGPNSQAFVADFQRLSVMIGYSIF